MVTTDVEETPKDIIEWKLDCGSQVHLCGVRDCFTHLQEVEGRQLVMMNGSHVTVKEKGSVVIMMQDGNTWKRCILQNV